MNQYYLNVSVRRRVGRKRWKGGDKIKYVFIGKSANGINPRDIPKGNVAVEVSPEFLRRILDSSDLGEQLDKFSPRKKGTELLTLLESAKKIQREVNTLKAVGESLKEG